MLMKTTFNGLITGIILLLSTLCFGQDFTQSQKIRFLEGDDCLRREINYKNLLTIAYADNRLAIDSLDRYKALYQKEITNNIKKAEEINWLTYVTIISIILFSVSTFFALKFYKKIP